MITGVRRCWLYIVLCIVLYIVLYVVLYIVLYIVLYAHACWFLRTSVKH